MPKPVLEVRVEDHLATRVSDAGGEVRKCVWSGRRGAPDRIVLFPKRHAWVEVKRPGAEPEPHQLREHEKMRAAGCDVWVIDNHKAVDIFVDHMTR